MFTYDADAEFDMGAPWYRPTRVDHLVVGSDFGWRAVTGTWPPYYPDHPGNAVANVDIGKGSPTGVKFGTHSSFPDHYRDALFVLDWAYGRILAVHLAPRGASYACAPVTIVKGRPLNVTDLDFHPRTGDMYVVTGGRKTRAGLYRIRYTGRAAAETTKQSAARIAFSRQQRALRRRLESLCLAEDTEVVENVWPRLGDSDPWIRYAARNALEHQPIELWSARALAERDPEIRPAACLALARSGQLPAAVVDRILDHTPSNHRTAAEALHACWLCLRGDAQLLADRASELLSWLDRLPRDSWPLRRDSSQILGMIQRREAATSLIDLLVEASQQHEQMHYLFVLRQQLDLVPEHQATYFQRLRDSRFYLHGQGMQGFLSKIREEAVASLSEQDKAALGDLIHEAPNAASVTVPEREFVKRWTVVELADSLSFDKADVARGKRLFYEAKCARCHRHGREGTPIGPELTYVSRRFRRADLLQSIIDPADVIAPEYQSVRVVTTDGRVLTGRLAPGGDYRSPSLRLATDVERPLETTEILKTDIVETQAIPQSWMPSGLLDVRTPQEIADLVSFLESSPAP